MPELVSTPEKGRPPRPEIIRETVKFLAEESRNVVLTDHAQERMLERDITSSMVFRVLRGGMISGQIEQGRKTGDWIVKMTGQMLANRDVGVVTAVVQNRKLVIITVEWEDLR